MSDIQPETSVIIPTWNRRELIGRAIDSVLAQTRPVGEIIVIDDGSTDGTQEWVMDKYGDRIVYLSQANAGVSAARNRGLKAARGRYIALLDSDDEWLSEKTERQVDYLERHPEYGMVLCDVLRVDADGALIDVFERRRQIPEDGMALRWVLRDPALAPLSALFRREVFETVGGFDESLRTAEDVDLHLRVAARWRIGVVEEPLARAVVRGHAGLSSLQTSYDDYLFAVERAAAAAAGRVPDDDIRESLAVTYGKCARGMIWHRRYRAATVLLRSGFAMKPRGEARRQLLVLMPLMLKCMVIDLRNRVFR